MQSVSDISGKNAPRFFYKKRSAFFPAKSIRDFLFAIAMMIAIENIFLNIRVRLFGSSLNCWDNLDPGNLMMGAVSAPDFQYDELRRPVGRPAAVFRRKCSTILTHRAVRDPDIGNPHRNFVLHHTRTECRRSEILYRRGRFTGKLPQGFNRFLTDLIFTFRYT